MLRNILGPMFNFNLDQFLTLEFCYFFCFFRAETPIFIVFSAKTAKLKETQKTKKDTICERTCANCSCQNVRFFCIFDFCCFWNFHVFSEMFLIGFPKSKNTKKTKQAKQKTRTKGRHNMQSKKKWNVMIQKQHKTTSRKTKTKEHLETKKQTQQKEKARTRKRKWKTGRKKEKNKRETQKEKGKKGGRPKKG